MFTRNMFVFLGSIFLFAAAMAADEPNFGAIDVKSEPPGAWVYIEGIFAGMTPLQVDRLSPDRSYRVLVKMGSYNDFFEDVEVTKGDIDEILARLRKRDQPCSARRDEDDWTPLVDADKKRYERARSQKRFRHYRVLELSNFLMKSDEEVPPDQLYSLFSKLAEQLDKKTKFEQLVTNYTAPTSGRWEEPADAADEPTLVLSGVITRYQRGSRMKRYIIGFGAGKTRLYCLFRLVDKKTGQVLLERMENGSISGGAFGGDSFHAIKEIAGDIAKRIKKDW